MKKVISLYDPKNGITYKVDSISLIFILDDPNKKREFRLKPFHATILSCLFNSHPQPVSYDIIEGQLMYHNLQCPDSTRLHRKVSEIRVALSHLHPTLDNFIQNTRGIGYSLPVHLRSSDALYTETDLGFKNHNLEAICEKIEPLIKNAVQLSSQASVIMQNNVYLMDRQPLRSQIEESITQFDEIEKHILLESKTSKVDFSFIHLRYILLKLRTYISLARINETPITQEKWAAQFTQEIWALFYDLQKIIRTLK